jgi:uncharacterized membrane protein YphA (DoxX/SURF4 family)
MTVVRAIARPLLSGLFIIQGAKAIRNPEPLVPKAKPVADRMVPLVKKVAPPQVGDRIPESTKNLVRLNGAAQVLGGVALASGSARRTGAGLLAATLVPTTMAGHRFSEESDPDERRRQQTQFLKNLSVMGGLLLAIVDTEGKPGLAWRATHSTRAAKREGKRAAEAGGRQSRRLAAAAKREAKDAARAARREAKTLKREAKHAARLAKAELPLGN